MTDYYRVLEVSPGASQEQIKARYRQLVRIYHPDRVVDPTDKLFVEQKLKEINEAYNALTNPDRDWFLRGSSALPQPVVLPPDGLDFGKVRRGGKQTLAFQVGNTGGAAQKFRLSYDEQAPWLRVTQGERIYPDKPFPIEFVVGVNTNALEPGRTYSTWIDVNMDDVISRVPLSVQVVEKRWFWPISPQLAAIGLMIALILVMVAAPNVRSLLPKFVTVEYLAPALPGEAPGTLSQVTSLPGVPPTPTVELIARANATGRSGLGVTKSAMSPAILAVAAVQTMTSTNVAQAAHSMTITNATRTENPCPPAATAQMATPIAHEAAITARAVTVTLISTPVRALVMTTPTVTATPVTTVTVTSTPTNTVRPIATHPPTLTPTSMATPIPSPTATSIPTNPPTLVSTKTSTSTPSRTSTSTPIYTPSNTPRPTATNAPTSTPVPPTATATNSPTATALPILTATATWTATPLPTATNIATFTPLPTFTPTRAPTRTPLPTEAIPSSVMIVVGTPHPLNQPWAMVSNPSAHQVSMRADASSKAAVVAALATKAQVAGIGRTIDNAWALVQLPDGSPAWVLTSAVVIDPAYFAILPVVTPNADPQ